MNLFDSYSNPYYNDVVSNELEQFAGLNGLMWDSCAKTDNRFTCSEPDYLARACQRFPTVVAKIVRLRLNLTRNLLENPQFRRLKIVFLVRDPRATMLSRPASFASRAAARSTTARRKSPAPGGGPCLRRCFLMRLKLIWDIPKLNNLVCVLNKLLSQ